MIKIIDKRCTGKTSRLILLAKETGATIVCNRPKHVQSLAERYGIDGLNIISYGDYLKRGSRPSKEVLIDEIDGLIQQLPSYCIGYSMSIEEDKG